MEILVHLFIYLWNCWSLPMDKECSHSSRQAFLSSGPYEFLGDSSHCTLIQAPLPGTRHTPTYTNRKYRVQHVKQTFQNIFSQLSNSSKKSETKLYFGSLLYLGQPTTPDNWDGIHIKLMTPCQRCIIAANCNSFHGSRVTSLQIHKFISCRRIPITVKIYSLPFLSGEIHSVQVLQDLLKNRGINWMVSDIMQ